MSDHTASHALIKFDEDPLRAIERKLVIASLALGISLLTLLGLFAHV